MAAPLLAAVALQIAAGWPWTGANVPNAHIFKPDGKTILSGRWHGRPVSLQLTPAVVPACHAADWLHGAVPDRQDRCVRIGRIEVTVAGASMPISSDAYADLGGVNDVVLQVRSGRMVLYMRGPDGPDYYGATLVFGHSDIVSRRLDLADGGREVSTYTAAPSQDR